MKVYIEITNKYELEKLIYNSQAKENYNIINQQDKVQDFIDIIDDIYPESDGGISETSLNDILAYEWEWVFDILEISYVE